METRCEKCNNGNAKSMKQVLANPDRYHVEQAIKLADTQVGRNGQVLTLPLHYIWELFTPQTVPFTPQKLKLPSYSRYNVSW